MDLKEFRATVLRLDKPEDVLRLADTYIQQAELMGDAFRLPKDHALVKPAIDYYAGDLPGWIKFVKGVRDRLPVVNRQYHVGVQEFYRTLVVRQTQIERRIRLDAAVAVGVRKKLIADDYESKQKYARRCTQVWKLRRDNMLAMHSKSTSSGRLTVAEREGLLQDFWKQIDEEITNGEVPKP